jgi:hypothetical protein
MPVKHPHHNIFGGDLDGIIMVPSINGIITSSADSMLILF